MSPHQATYVGESHFFRNQIKIQWPHCPPSSNIILPAHPSTISSFPASTHHATCPCLLLPYCRQQLASSLSNPPGAIFFDFDQAPPATTHLAPAAPLPPPLNHSAPNTSTARLTPRIVALLTPRHPNSMCTTKPVNPLYNHTQVKPQTLTPNYPSPISISSINLVTWE